MSSGDPEGWQHPRARAAEYGLAALFAAASLVLTGFVFGLHNNVFHIPYVLDLASTREFAGDAFYATLDRFVSILWPAIRAVTNEGNIESVFLAAHILSRVAAFLALVPLLRANDIRSPYAMALCLGTVAAAPWLREASVIGEHGMFLVYFTHTEVTWPLIFLALAFLQQRRLNAAAAVAAATFCINAFVGMWLAVILPAAAIAARQAYSRRELLVAGAVGFVISLPVALWIGSFMGSADQAVTFSYIEYIRAYYPKHSLIEAAPVRNGIVPYALLGVVGVVASLHLAARRFWFGVFAGCFILFAAGAALPYVLDNRFVFNLHLLRSAGLVQAFAVIVAGIAGARLVLDPESLRRRAMGLVVLVSLLAHMSNLDLAVVTLALVAALGVESRRGIVVANALAAAATVIFIGIAARAFAGGDVLLIAPRVLGVAVLALFAVRTLGERTVRFALMGGLAVTWAFTGASFVRERVDRAERLEVATDGAHWRELTSWIRRSDLAGPFLLPTRGAHPLIDRFHIDARRRAWVDWKQGAAVMWAPGFYPQWRTRYDEVRALATPEALVAYAGEKGIRNVIIESASPQCPAPGAVVRASGRWVLCALR